MRKLLLAGVALAGVAAYMPTTAMAQSAVFPETTRAGKLDGAAPGSVSVSIGGRLFTAIEFEGGSGDSGPSKTSEPNLVNYIRFYPSFDYANPAGIHFGAAMELRVHAATQGTGSDGNVFGFSGVGYVSSDKFGKFEVGTPNSATDELGVGTGDDFGTGGFYSEYGWVHAPNFIMTDSYDGDTPHQKLAYLSPSFAGFKLGVSYQPTAVGLNNSGGLVDNLPLTSSATGAQSKDRVEVAGQYAHAFGPASVKASIGYAEASPSVVGNLGGYQNVSLFDAGAQVNVAGFEVEGSVVTGKASYGGNDGGSNLGPLMKGAKDTTAYIVGAGYGTGPFSIGVVYYGVSFDVGDATATPSLLKKGGTVSGVAVGGSYVVGPGVSVNFDVATDTIKTTSNVHGTVGAVGAYFEW